MDIAVVGKKLDVGSALRAHVRDHLEPVVTKYFSRAHDANVTFSREAHLFRADITVHPVRGMVVQAHAAGDDAYSAFESSLERVAKQIRRYKRRITNHHGRRSSDEPLPALQYIIAAEDETEDEPADDAQPTIIAELPTEIDTLTVSEAVMRMDLADAPAMMFRNRANGGLNVVYRRPDGNIGWIDPTHTQQGHTQQG